MPQKQSVFLYGRSLLMAGIEASLSAVPGLTIQCNDLYEGQLPDSVRIESPDFVVFELGAISDTTVLTLLRERPTVHLIGLDLERNRLLVLSGWQHSAPDTAALVRIIQGQANTQ